MTRIVVDRVWKKFRRGERHDSLRDLIPGTIAKLTQRAPKPDDLTNDEFWVLRDVLNKDFTSIIVDDELVYEEVRETLEKTAPDRVDIVKHYKGKLDIFDNYGINKQMLDSLNKEMVIMHPGPINRGVEINSDVADSKNSIILDQVENGVAIRMAVIYLLSGKGDLGE